MLLQNSSLILLHVTDFVKQSAIIPSVNKYTTFIIPFMTFSQIT